MKNNKKLIAIVAAIVLALIGLIVYIMKDSNEVTSNQNQSGQLVNFQGADLQEEKDGKLVWALSAEKIEYDPRTKAIVLTNLKGLFYQDDVTTTITAPHAVLTGDRNSLDIDQGVTATNTEGAEFKTEALHFDNKTKTLTSKTAFTYNSKDITLTGDKLEGNMSLKIIKAIGNAKLTKKQLRGNMMNKKKQIGMAILAVLMTASVTVWAANNDPLTISADTLSYDGNTGRADAKGNVVITQADKTMTGASGWYNTKNQEASLDGGVSMIGSDMAMSAQSVHSYNNNKFTAKGGVHLQRGDRQIFGDTVEYNTEKEYGLVTGNARLIAEGTTLTGNKVEGWLKEIRAVAQGNVTFSNPERNVSGSSDRATYTQTPNQNDGVVLLSGSAHAVQNGNVLNAPELKIRLADDSAETLGGRSTLIIVPNQ